VLFTEGDRRWQRWSDAVESFRTGQAATGGPLGNGACERFAENTESALFNEAIALSVPRYAPWAGFVSAGRRAPDVSQRQTIPFEWITPATGGQNGASFQNISCD
jgi:hypothetical protein